MHVTIDVCIKIVILKNKHLKLMPVMDFVERNVLLYPAVVSSSCQDDLLLALHFSDFFAEYNDNVINIATS